jgi:hypothetical protein
MKKAWAILFILLISSCAGLLLKGKVMESRYYSPMNDFSIALPRLMEMKIEDQVDPYGGSVAFLEPTGRFWVVDYMKLPPNFASKHSSQEKRDEAYRMYVIDMALQNALKYSSQSSIVKEAFIDVKGSRGYFAIINIPEGSRLTDAVTKKRLDSVRGHLVFEKNGFMYMPGCEMNYAGERINAFSLTDKQVEKTKETLGQIKESMIFR